MRAAMFALAAALAGCGMAEDAGMGPDADADAGTGGGCQLALSGPDPMTVGQEALFAVQISGGDGLHSLSWSVTRSGEPVELFLEADDTRARFTPTTAGLYRVAVTGSVGGEPCTPAVTDANALAAGTAFVAYRLRVAPPAASGIPAQILEVELPAGSDYGLGPVVLDRGVLAAGTVVAGGEPIAAYLRATRVDDPVPSVVEGFSGADGRFALRLADGSYRFRVVPEDPSRAPYELTAAADALGGTLDIGTGVTVTGSVTRAGAPLPGAQLSLVVDGVPSALAAAGADGRFEVAVQAGIELSIRVAPPPGSALPVVELFEAAGPVAAGTAVAVDYAGAAPVAVNAVLEGPGGPLPGARAVFTAAELAGAAAARVDGGAALAMPGRVRREVVADASGRVTLSLPAGDYQVAVRAADGTAALAAVTLGPDAPAAIAVPAPAQVSGRLLSSDGQPLAGTARARPRGVLAAAAMGGASAEIGSDGRFALALAGGAVYDLALVPGEGRGGRLFAELAPGPGQALELGDLSAPAAVTASGELLLPGGQPLAGAQLSLLCGDCGGLAASRPLAEAVTDAAGRFALHAADPGAP